MTKSKLINCPVCNKEISKSAKICMGCGAKNKHRKSLLGWIFIVILGFYLIGLVIPDSPSGNNSNAAPVAEQLELSDWSCSQEHGYSTAEGRVKNISDKPLHNIQVVAEHFAKDGTFITSDSALIEYNPIMPGQTSPFKALTPYNPLMAKCNVSFKTLSGSFVGTKEK
jgi:hypothetical protein